MPRSFEGSGSSFLKGAHYKKGTLPANFKGITGYGADPRYLQKRVKKSPDVSSGGEVLPGWLHFDGSWEQQREETRNCGFLGDRKPT